MTKRTLLALILLLALGITVASAQDAPQTPAEICANNTPAADPATRDFPGGAAQVLEEGVDYRAIMCTDAGPIYFDLFEKYAPITVNNFVFLAQEGYYNNTIFHRVLADFMAQGGDPTATGTGGPGYSFQDEFVGFLHFDQPGFLAMANAGPGTNGSQFFITTVPTQHLNYKHTIFGEVLEGQENADAIMLRDPSDPGAPATTLQTVVIITDPDSVVTTYEAPPLATADEVLAAFNGVNDLITPDLGASVTSSLQTTDEVLAAAADAEQSDLETYLTSHNHQFRASGSLTNDQCAFDALPFISLSYSLDAFTTPEDAAAAMDDPLFTTVATDEGFGGPTISPSAGLPMYQRSVTACDQTALEAQISWQRGRFVATARVILPTDSQDLPYIDLWVDEVAARQVFEQVLSGILRPEIWN